MALTSPRRFSELVWSLESEFTALVGYRARAVYSAAESRGKVQNVCGDSSAFYRDMSAKGGLFSLPPKKQDFGGVLAQFVDSEGAHCSVGDGGGVAPQQP